MPELVVLRAPAVANTQSMHRAYSAGRMWVVLPAPALLPRFWRGTGVGSGAWVPAQPPNRLTPLGLSCETICRPGPRLTAPASGAGLIGQDWGPARGHSSTGEPARAL